MRTFRQRSDADYQEHLAQCLRLDGENGLIFTAEDLLEPVVETDRKFAKAISLDFLAFTATTLLDPGAMIAKHCHFDKLRTLLAAIPELNRQGILVRIRLLLCYPYSAAGQIRIQAEHCSHRTTIDQPKARRGLEFLEEPTDHIFRSSSLFSTLHSSLKQLYLLSELCPDGHPRLATPNRFSLRLSPFNPIICGLRINTRFFFDVYSYAKQKTGQRICSGDTQPVIEVCKDDGLPYESFCDHFRYLWQHDATLDAEDVVDISDRFDPRVRLPSEVTFSSKLRRLSRQTRIEPSETEGAHFLRRSQGVLRRHCPDIRASTGNERAFLACAWRSERSAPARPVQDAIALRALWERNFSLSNHLQLPPSEIQLVEAVAGNMLSASIYDALNNATIGLVLLSPERPTTKDSPGPHECTPNVYHELGYLMARLPRERILVFKEASTKTPSNLDGLVWIEYTEGQIGLGFLKVLETLRTIRFLSDDQAKRAAESHLLFLMQRVASEKITSEQLDWAQKFVSERFGPHSSVHAT